MIDLRFRPIDKPIVAPKGGRKRAPFKAPFKTVLDDLERELGYLKATDIVVEAALQLSDIRNDGWPRSSARPTTPGIRLSFMSKHGPLSYDCGTYDEWEGNLRAIGLTLESLRAVDRYGAVKGGEQYKGWAALPEKAGGGTVEDAARVILDLGGHPTDEANVKALLASREHCANLRNRALRRHHPDLTQAADAAANTERINEAFKLIDTLMGPTWAKGAA